MRIPLPLVFLLAFAVIGGVWWYNTRGMDFLTPPPESELAVIREHVEASLPRPGRPEDAVSVPSDVLGGVAVPDAQLDLGDLNAAPELDAYVDQSELGAAHFIRLAEVLETRGEFQRALLAWERVIDRGSPKPEERVSAIAAIQRLRPTLPSWNNDKESAIPVVLHAGSGPKFSKDLESVLKSVARKMNRASSGVLNVTVSVATGRASASSDGPVPVAIWLAGPGREAASTDVMSFTASNPEDLGEQVERTVYTLVRGHLMRSAVVNPPELADENADPAEAFNTKVTRLGWMHFGTSLNQLPDAEE